MNLSYKQVLPSELTKYWLLVRPQIEKALAYSGGEANSEHYRRQIEAGKVQLFIAEDENGNIPISMLTFFMQYQIRTALKVITIAGDEAGILEQCVIEYFPTLIEWAKRNGAASWEASCHPAMARLLKQHGFKTLYQVVSLDLES